MGTDRRRKGTIEHSCNHFRGDMASLRQAARAANSATLEEARSYVLEFYRMVRG